ncbi:MAG: carbohydrate ABC transporter permease [Firmicutes bacterium]|nr:carbohydrate ABC transporter permease [Bacillota bacterium]
MAKIRLRKRNLPALFFIYLAALVVFFVAVFPFGWMLSTSLKRPEDTFTSVPKLIPPQFTLENYRRAFQDTLLGRYILNSLYVASVVTLASLVLATLAGYGFSRFRFPGRQAWLLFILCIQMLPSVVIIIPLFIVMRNLHALNSHWALLVSYPTFTLPLSIWMLKGFFDEIPRELEEVAQIDGCSVPAAFFRVILPLTLPGITASGIYAFIGAWNEFMFAMTFINHQELYTMPVGLNAFFGQFTVEWNQLMAASVFFTLPSLVFFLLVRKYLARGIVGGAVKG